jgi:hypothetical protein
VEHEERRSIESGIDRNRKTTGLFFNRQLVFEIRKIKLYSKESERK